MKFEDVIALASRETGVSESTARLVLRAAFAMMTQAIAEHNRVAVPRFGAFSVVRRAGRKVRHPKTGEFVHVRARSVPVFRPFEALRSAARSRPAK
jgi:DNA-binding protein HU-beta